MQDKETLGAFIKQKRIEKNLTQSQLAQKLYVTKFAVSKWERGISYPDISLIQSICAALEISKHELLTASSDKESLKNKTQAQFFRKIQKAYIILPTVCYIIALIVCFICNLAIDKNLTWFWVVASALICAFTFIPGFYSFKFNEKNKFFIFLLTTLCGICLIIIACAFYTLTFYWLLTALVSVITFYTALFLPLLIKKFSTNTRIVKFRYIIDLGAITLLTIILVASVKIYSNFSFIRALLVDIYFLIPFFICGFICLTRIKTLVKVGICTFIASCFAYFSVMVIKFIFLQENTLSDYIINFNNWNECLTGNISLISMCFLICASAVIILSGIFARRKK